MLITVLLKQQSRPKLVLQTPRVKLVHKPYCSTTLLQGNWGKAPLYPGRFAPVTRCLITLASKILQFLNLTHRGERGKILGCQNTNKQLSWKLLQYACMNPLTLSHEFTGYKIREYYLKITKTKTCLSAASPSEQSRRTRLTKTK